MVVRGAAAPERLAAGAAGTVLAGKGAGVMPAYDDKAHKMFNGADGDNAIRSENGLYVNGAGDLARMYMWRAERQHFLLTYTQFQFYHPLSNHRG